ncbi:MAG: ATP-binding protein [Hyphomonas sp.]|uniref:sensor histidine kinase n=1 Tax=Hyphomonas sp. TaxID=87 RepID=UPI00349FF39E
MRFAVLSLFALTLVSGAALAQAPDAAAPTPFEQAVAAAKSKMMADPAAAYELALEVGNIASSDELAGTAQTDETATALWLEGEALNRLNRVNEAIPRLEQGLEIARAQASDEKVFGDLMIARAGAARISGDYALALTHYQGAQKVFADLNEDRSQALALQQVGSIYTDARDYTKALEFYKRAGEAFSGDPSVNVSRLNNISHAQRELGNLAGAEAGFREALAIAIEMDSASLQARILANLASVQLAAGRLDEADATARSGLALSNGGKPLGWESFLWGVGAQIAFERGAVSEAAVLIARTFEGQNIDQTPMPYREFHEAAQEIYSSLGQTELALQHFKSLKRLDDDALSVSTAANTALMAVQFDFAGQELNLAKLRTEALEKEVALSRAKARQRTILFGGLLVFSLIALIAGALHYNSMRRSRNAIRSANETLKQTNTALAKALKAKSEFLATTSHEIRTPLNGILGMTQLLMMRRDLAADVRERVELVHASSETMKAIVDDILDLAKLESGVVTIDRSEYEVPATLNSVSRFWRDSADSKGLILTADIEAGLGVVEGDERRVRQIVFNLLSNAIKFTDAGSVRIDAKMERADGGSFLLIEVADTGCGIQASEHEAIFEAFHQVDGGTTRKHGGTGLGLSICRKLARAMNGDVTMTSASGAGSVFTLRLPVVEVAAFSRGSKETGTERRVLVLDSNLMRQSMLEALLSGDDSEVVTADDLASGLAAVLAGRFDAVFVFANELGDANAAMANIIKLRECAADTRLVAFLEAGSQIEPQMLHLAGFDEILEGPFEPLLVIAALSKPSNETETILSVHNPEKNAA